MSAMKHGRISFSTKKIFLNIVLNFTYSRRQPKNFAFDHCFNSVDSGDPTFAGQEQVFQCLGHDILDNAFQGYNACIFAYGQTGIKKDYLIYRANISPRFMYVSPRISYANWEAYSYLNINYCYMRK